MSEARLTSLALRKIRITTKRRNYKRFGVVPRQTFVKPMKY